MQSNIVVMKHGLVIHTSLVNTSLRLSMSKVTHSRHIAKTLTWRVLATTDTFLITYFLGTYFGVEQAVAVAGSVATLEVITKMFLYYMHERVWYKYVKFGIKDNADV
jgi:uncharacterized membrane protein